MSKPSPLSRSNGSESLGEVISSLEDIESDTDSSKENTHAPVMKSRTQTNFDLLNITNLLNAKFLRILSGSDADSRFHNMSKENIHRMVYLLKNNPQLKTTKLEIALSEIGVDEVKLLAETISDCKTITEVSFEKCNIGDEVIKVFVKAIKNDPDCKITKLCLANNDISSEGAKALADLLKKNTSINELDLRRNNIRLDGLKALVESIKTNGTLTSLNLEANYIDALGAEDLAGAIKNNPDCKITKLCLADNVIYCEGAKAFADLLTTNTSIHELDLSANGIEREGIKALAASLKTNVTLTLLNLEDTRFDAESTKDLAEAMEMNSSIIELKIGQPRDINCKLDKEIIKQQSGLNKLKPQIENTIAAALDLLSQNPNPDDGIITSAREVNDLIAQKLFTLDKGDKLISAKIRKNPNTVINKYT